MKSKKIEVSKEYIQDHLIPFLKWWVEKEDSFVISQFLSERGISWTVFKELLQSHEDLQEEFDIIIARLHVRWFHLGMNSKELPSHKQKILSRYLKVYDNHGYYQESESKKDIIGKEGGSFHYVIENFSNAKVSERLKKLCDTSTD